MPLIFLQHDRQDKSGKKTRIVRLIVCFLKVFSKDLWEILLENADNFLTLSQDILEL